MILRFFVAAAFLLGAQADAQNVTTYRYDNQVSGVNAKETVLTPANVKLASFGQLFKDPIDGQAYAQPLYLAHVAIAGKGVANVVYVCTCHDTVYAFDADAGGDPLWVTSFLAPEKGVTTVPQPDISSGDIIPEIGIVGTPVIDAATGTLYVVAKTKETGRGDNHTHYVQKLHALDVASGQEKFNGPAVIGDTTHDPGQGDYDYNLQACPQTPSVKGKGAGNINGTVYFSALRANQRPSLSIDHGVVYVAWSSHGDVGPYHGWVAGFNAKTLAPMPNAVFCVTPDGDEGGIWQAGCGPCIDATGHLYFSTGNGFFDGDKTRRNWSQTFLKLATRNGLSTAKGPHGPHATYDFFSPFNELDMSNHDVDIGAGGMTLFDAPSGAVPHLAVGSGKIGCYFVLNRDNLGGFDPTTDNVVQKFEVADGREIMTTPVYFNKAIFYNRNGDELRARLFAHGRFSDAFGRTASHFGSRGGGPVISANGTKDGVLWIIDNGIPATLKAYSTDALRALPSNSAVPSLYEGQLPDGGVKFVHPLEINGKVYAVCATRKGNTIASAHLVAFGLLPASWSTAVPEAPAHVTAVSSSPINVSVSWVAYDYNTTGFTIKRGLGDTGELTQVGTVEKSASSFSDSTVTGATVYRYVVSAVNHNGNSPDSAPFTLPSHDFLREDGLVAYWSFDEGTGTTVSDLTGQGHAGRQVGEVSWGPGVRNTPGLDFHGTGNARSHIEVQDSNDLKYGENQSFSIVAWARPASLPGHWAGVVVKAREAPSGWYGLYLNPDNRWAFRGFDDKTTISGGTALPNSWQQIVAVQDATAKTRMLYVNGVLVATGAAAAGDSPGPLWIGQGDADEESFAGSIDDVRFYQRALTPDDVTKLRGKYLPTVALTEPADATTGKAGDNLTLAANAAATGGASVNSVHFFQRATELGNSHDKPAHYDWKNIPPGDYVLTATVTDSNGNTTISAPVHVKITP